VRWERISTKSSFLKTFLDFLFISRYFLESSHPRAKGLSCTQLLA
jgi:hypothetical protein